MRRVKSGLDLIQILQTSQPATRGREIFLNLEKF
jgi:hypothetical protein